MGQRHIDRAREPDGDEALAIRLGREELAIRRRYQTLSILNDFLIGVWFTIGSVCFLFPAWLEVGTWLFILGSAQLLVRPLIRLAHRLHLRRAPASSWEL
ncbi:MAG: YrhK family protein [Halofilum sp. (in: g-proteobacteria)]|nr:YrhK family protein [Halofilum sp. (in: g-proteobacteria)]